MGDPIRLRASKCTHTHTEGARARAREPIAHIVVDSRLDWELSSVKSPSVEATLKADTST